MIDRFYLSPGEAYEFQTDGNQYVVVVSATGGGGIEIWKGESLLATLGWMETYSCPANTGSYVVKNPSGVQGADVLLVRYILL
jgi:hypothetical protein